jgi:hypothetical protein
MATTASAAPQKSAILYQSAGVDGDITLIDIPTSIALAYVNPPVACFSGTNHSEPCIGILRLLTMYREVKDARIFSSPHHHWSLQLP